MIRKSDNKEEKEVKEEEVRRNQELIDQYDYLGNAVSSNDCTGLMPFGYGLEEELEVYDHIYRFGSPETDEKQNNK